MFYVANARQFNWLVAVFDDLFHEVSKSHGMRSTQKEQAQLAGIREGLVTATVNVLVAVGTEQRIHRIKDALGGLPNENVPMVDFGQVRSWVSGEVKRIQAGEQQNKEENWAAYVSEVFAELVWPDEMIATYDQKRRQLILDGKLEPDARDTEWLQAHIESLKPSITKMQELVDKAAKAGKK